MALTDYEDYGSPAASAPAPYLRPASRSSRYLMPIGNNVGSFTPTPGAQQLLQPVNVRNLFSNPNAAPQFTTLATPAQPQQMFQSTRSQPIQQQINASTTATGNTAAQGRQSLTDLTRDYISSRGQVKKAADEETNAISDIYNPNGLEARLNQINRQRQAGVSNAAQSAIGRALRAANVARMQSGNSSYLDRALAQNLADIQTNAAVQGADQSRADLQYLTGQRTGQTGQRQAIIDRLLQRDMVPVQAGLDFERQNLGNLGLLSNLDQSNNVYENPETAYTRRLNFIQDLINRGILTV